MNGNSSYLPGRRRLQIRGRTQDSVWLKMRSAFYFVLQLQARRADGTRVDLTVPIPQDGSKPVRAVFLLSVWTHSDWKTGPKRKNSGSSICSIRTLPAVPSGIISFHNRLRRFPDFLMIEVIDDHRRFTEARPVQIIVSKIGHSFLGSIQAHVFIQRPPVVSGFSGIVVLI